MQVKVRNLKNDVPTTVIAMKMCYSNIIMNVLIELSRRIKQANQKMVCTILNTCIDITIIIISKSVRRMSYKIFRNCNKDRVKETFCCGEVEKKMTQRVICIQV